MQRGAGFAAFVVIGDDHGVFVEHGGLEAAVGADEGAGLFAEAREDRVEHEGEEDHEREADDVLARVVADDAEELVAADDVAQEGVADDEGEAEEYGVFAEFLAALRGVQGAASRARCSAASPSMASRFCGRPFP